MSDNPEMIDPKKDTNTDFLHSPYSEQEPRRKNKVQQSKKIL